MDDLIQQGVDAFKSGNRESARKLLSRAIKQNPDSERAWGWMYNVCNTDQERIQCLRQLVRINPQNKKAAQAFAQLSGEPVKPIVPRISPKLKNSRKKNNLFIYAIIGGTLFTFCCSIAIFISFLTSSIIPTPTLTSLLSPTLTLSPIPTFSETPRLPVSSETPQTMPSATPCPTPSKFRATSTLFPTADPIFTEVFVTPIIFPTAPGGNTNDCCKHCGPNSKPCGNSCISLKYTCHKAPGCACY